jgi:hypothetical protein
MIFAALGILTLGGALILALGVWFVAFLHDEDYD